MKSVEKIVSAIADGTLRESATIEMKTILPCDLSTPAKAIVGIANSGVDILLLVLQNNGMLVFRLLGLTMSEERLPDLRNYSIALL